jgi:tRNA(Ile)-lysidine synthase
MKKDLTNIDTNAYIHQFQRRVKEVISSVKGIIIVGVSGGADSVALLRSLVALHRNIIAVHCNFHLRGEESDRDMHFVMKLCEQLNVELIVKEFNTKEYCSQNKVSIETGCRDLRYAFFRELLNHRNASRIAVAHNADDNTETLFLNLFRGSGINGLAAMRPDTGEILRPLIDIGRDEIELYLKSLGQSHITDSSNLENIYRRNFIRNELIPLIETRWEGAKKAIRRTQINLRGESAMLSKLKPKSGNFIERETILSGDPLTITANFSFKYGANRSMAEEMARAVMSGTIGQQWKVSNGKIVSERNGLQFISQKPESSNHDMTEEISCNFITAANHNELMDIIRKNNKPIIFFTPLSKDEYIWRHPKAGDRIRPIGMSGSSLISDIMKDAKLTTLEKQNILVAESKQTGEIIWLEGLKRSRIDAVSETASECYAIERKSK